MKLILDDGSELRFGQSLEEVESLFSCSATQRPSPIARRPVDRFISGKNVALDFDAGRLKRVTLESGYQFVHPPTPYPEAWMNFPVIGSQRIFRRMPREEFLSYLEAWKSKAKVLGTEEADFGDLTSQQLAVSIVSIADYDSIDINMGPTRRAGGGGIWCDGWIATFTKVPGDSELGEKVSVLERLSAFRDEFNTVARKL